MKAKEGGRSPAVEILERAVEGFIFIDAGKRLGYVNAEARRLLRASRSGDSLPGFADLVQLLNFDPLGVPEEESAVPESSEARLGEEPRPDILQQRRPGPVLRQEITIFGTPCLLQSVPLYSARGAFRGTVLWLRDLREERRREQAFSEACSFASHELRTPITAIKNSLDLLSSHRLGTTSEQQQRFLQLASRNVDRLMTLVGSLLDLHGLEARTLSLDLEETDLTGPVEQALAAVEDLAREKKNALQKDFPEKLPRLIADSRRLTQVVYNLVHNAVKFTPEGGTVRVKTESLVSGAPGSKPPEQMPKSRTAQPLLLTVSDTGVGIPASHVKSIFRSFTRVDPEAPGRGLGLFLVKALVEAHGGTVWVESQPGKGSTFRVLLPVLSREGHLVKLVESSLERARTAGSPMTLIILKVTTSAKAALSGRQQQQEAAHLLQGLVTAARSVVRLRNARVGILDSSRGLVSLLAGIRRQDARALVRRIARTLERQTQEQERAHAMELVWAVAAYPEDAASAEDLVAFALRSLSEAKAEVVPVPGGR